MESLQDDLVIADKFTNGSNLFDIGAFSKILNIKGLGRNKMFEWLRDNKILMKSKAHINEPYQNQMDHFEVIQVETPRGNVNKTLLKGAGVKYLVKKLIADGKLSSEKYDNIMQELENRLIAQDTKIAA